MDAMMDMSTNHGSQGQPSRAQFRTYDRNNLQYPCSLFDERYGYECYRIQTALILYLNHGSLPAAAQACDHAPPVFRSACYQSLGRDITSYADYERVRAVQYCGIGNTTLRAWCYVGVANTLIDEGAKPEAGFAVCRGLTDAGYRKICFTDLGEMLISLVATPAEREHWCALPADADRRACRTGAQLVGWPGTETDPATRTTSGGGAGDGAGGGG